MAQTAVNGQISFGTGAWERISEINCTFVVQSGVLEVLGNTGAEPDAGTQRGILYEKGEGEAASTDVLSWFVGAGGTATQLWGRARLGSTAVFVSRQAVS